MEYLSLEIFFAVLNMRDKSKRTKYHIAVKNACMFCLKKTAFEKKTDIFFTSGLSLVAFDL